MRLRTTLASSLTIALLAACQGPAGSGNATLDSNDQKASYGIGLNMGSQLGAAESHIDMEALIDGLVDGMAGNEPRVPESELQTVLQELSATIQAEEAARVEAESEANAAAGEAFLAENAEKDGVIVTESGLQYEILREGEGAAPAATDRVSIHYKGTLLDGTQFDSSYDRGEPAVFGVSGVIAGFSEGLMLMSEGSHYRFYIPSDLAYGPTGSGGAIGPNSTLIFEIELLEVVE
jgi:FKBP-type peptidyl-prolyl cis-trans isomerase